MEFETSFELFDVSRTHRHATEMTKVWSQYPNVFTYLHTTGKEFIDHTHPGR